MHRVVLLFTGICLFLSCTSSPGDGGAVRIATLKGPGAISMIPLIHETLKPGDRDTTLEFLVFDEPMQVRSLMLRQETDIAVLPSTLGALMYNMDVPYHLAAIAVWGNLYLLGPAGPPMKWESLRGERVHLMARGMTPDILFRYLVQQNGLDPEKDIRADYSFPTHIDLAQAMAGGRVRYGVVSEPSVTMVLDKNNALVRMFDLNQEWQKVRGDSLPIPQTAVMVKASFANDHPEKLKEFIDRYREACGWVNRNPEAAGELLTRHGIMPDGNVAARSIPYSNIRLEMAANVEEAIYDYFRVFYAFDPRILGGKLPDEQFILKK